MKRGTRALVCAGGLLLGTTPVAAQDDEGFFGYMAGAANQVLVGSQSLLFAPLDPLAETIWPPEELEDLPAAPVTSRVVGAGAGLLLGGYRLLMGATDLLLSPVPMDPVSPTLRFSLFPSVTQYRTGDPDWICDMDGWGEEAETWAHRAGTLACFPWTKGTPQDAEEE